MSDAPRLRAMGLGEILDAAFRLYRENFLKFSVILAVAYVPVTIVSMAMTAFVLSGIKSVGGVPFEALTPEQVDVGVQAQMEALGPDMVVMFVGLFLHLLIAQPLATGALTRAVGARYLNEEIGIGKAYRAIGAVFFRYLGTVLLTGLVIALGLPLCAIPALIFMTWFAFVSESVVLEGLSGTKAMGRSRELVRGYGWRVFGYLFLVGILNFIVLLALAALADFLIPLIASGPTTVALLHEAFQSFVGLFIAPYFIVVLILLYYDLRVRKEAFDLEILARNLAVPAALVPPP